MKIKVAGLGRDKGVLLFIGSNKICLTWEESEELASKLCQAKFDLAER